MAEQSLFQRKFVLAVFIPWSIVLILGTLLFNKEFSQAQPDAPVVVSNDTGNSGSESVGEVDKAKLLLDNVKKEYLKISSKDDREIIYKLLSGGAEYLKHAVSLTSTRQFDPILARVQSSYGWDRETYPAFTDAVSEYLQHAGYDEPRSLESEEDRAWFLNIFESLAQAIK